MDITFWITQTLHAMQFSMLLFLLSVGLSVIFGLLHFVNLAHGSFYALGAYICYSLVEWSGSFWLSFFLTPVAVGVIGLVVYQTLIKRMRSSGPMNQVLITFGLIFIFLDSTRMIWGDISLGVEKPALLSHTIEFMGVTYPSYRLFIIALGFLILGILHTIVSKTQVGAIIRAGVDNEDMATCMGIDTQKVFFVVFCIGCALAGLAGAVAVPILSASVGMGTSILIPTLIVVVIGGLGSLKGSLAGSLLIGFIQTFGIVLAPMLSSILVYILLATVLILKPNGFFPIRK